LRPEISIKEIIQGCLKGEPQFQRLLVDKYSDRLYAICIRYLKDKVKAKDALQESLIKVFKNFNTYDESKASLPTWMTTITIRQCISKLRKRELDVVSIEAAYGVEVSLTTSALDELQNQDLVKLIHELPAGYREVFNLAVVDGLSHKEIAALLDINEGASRSRLSRAKKLLKEKIIALENQEQWVN